MPTISLTAGSTTVELPADLQWQDEHTHSRVIQSVETSLTGAPIIQAEALQYRPVTLSAVDDTSSWLTHEVVTQLRAWYDVPGQQMTLALRGSSYTVIWRHHEAPALTLQPVQPSDDPQPGDYYAAANLKLMTV